MNSRHDGLACVVYSAAMRARRKAGRAARAALVAASSAVSRAADPDDCGRPTFTGAGTSTRAGTATAPGDDGTCKLAFHDADTDFLASILADTSDTRD